MHRILFLPDIRPAGYPANAKAGYRISYQISCRKFIWLNTERILLVEYERKFKQAFKITILSKHFAKHFIVTIICNFCVILSDPVSGLTEYPALQSGIRPDTEYQKRPDYPAGRISGTSLPVVPTHRIFFDIGYKAMYWNNDVGNSLFSTCKILLVLSFCFTT
jgi:hypothetical protein